jgi:hypothetical protein
MASEMVRSGRTKPIIGVGNAGFALGSLLGGLHLLWALLVASGWAQPLMDFIFWLHFIRPVYMIEAFDPLRAAGLVFCSRRRWATLLAAPSPYCGTTTIASNPDGRPICLRANGHGALDRPRFSDELGDFAKTLNDERVTLATVIRFMGRRSIAALLLFLALPMALPIPAPGISVLFGLPLIVISAQLMVGLHRAWLPAWLARQSISRASFTSMAERAAPTLHRLEHIVRPRLSWMAGDWAMVSVGTICLVLGIIITLPIPLGHMLPGAAISILALGLLERDGLVIGIGLTTAAVALAVVAAATHGVVTWVNMYLSEL